MHDIDSVKLAFDESGLQTLNVVLGLIMFGVALDLRMDDFKQLARAPKAPAIGLVAQFLILPPLAWALSRFLAPTPSIALGMVLISACPGGNISNYMTWLAKGRTETSVGMTAVSTAAAVFMTPFNTTFWGRMSPDTAALVTQFQLDWASMFQTVLLLLGVPIVVGMTLAHYAPNVASKLRKPFKAASILFFFAFVAIAFSANFDHFLAWIGVVFLPVLVMNALAYGLGWGAGRVTGLDEADRRAVAIEVGIQNTGLGLVLVFNFFDGLGGMAVACAWWGIWHIVSGLALATWWSRHTVPEVAAIPG